MKITMLGSGTSSGVPRIGNDWGACDPAEPRNRRRRVSILVQTDEANILVDTGPDFREQMLDANIRHLDAVFITHSHADHTHGIDDLRQFFHLMGRPVECYAAPGTWDHLYDRFKYVFEGREGYEPTARANSFGPGSLTIGDIQITAFPQVHGYITSWGFCFEREGERVCYSTDFNEITEEGRSRVRGCDLWIVDSLRRRPHPTHAHLDRTLGWIKELCVKRAVLTHMDNSMDYRALCAELPAGVEPGYDMLRIDL
jgi:phosphoribosyl 1,2-cyclic phosphate phosphodiesterase|tara:strand:+ start:67224 stop:67991 length:768 start_codon:yes stop_codon:yes gene_type:complete